MPFVPTDEQEVIIGEFLAGYDLVVGAGAGAGKTKTLELLAKATKKQGIYVAFGAAIAAEAKGKFPFNVRCSTAHSLAFRSVGKNYSHRLNGPRMPSRVLAQRMKIYEPMPISGDKSIMPAQLARIVMETIQRFCYSADDAINSDHVPWQNGLDASDFRELKQVILPLAEQAWQDITNTNGTLPFSHDNYLKIWGLSHPRLNCDFVLTDEAQDLNPVVALLVAEQTHTQRVMVGDENQAIFGWRNAIDAMHDFDGKRLYLTQSFRFGQAIADEANKWLGLLNSPLQIKGFDQIDSRIDTLDEPRAILCRTNAGAVTEAIFAHTQGRKAALVGGGDQIKRLALAATDLQTIGHTDHPELFIFDSWTEVQEYAQDAAGSDLKVFVKLIDSLGAQTVIETIDRLVNEEVADVIVSTAHRAKGREWPTVRVSTDFFQPDEDKRPSREEMMLNYVTVTRAKEILDRGGLSYIDRILEEKPLTSLVEAATVSIGDQTEIPSEKERIEEMPTGTKEKTRKATTSATKAKASAKPAQTQKATSTKRQAAEEPVQKRRDVATAKGVTSSNKNGAGMIVSGSQKGHVVKGEVIPGEKPKLKVLSWTLPNGNEAPKKAANAVVGKTFDTINRAGVEVFKAMNEHYGTPENLKGRWMIFKPEGEKRAISSRALSTKNGTKATASTKSAATKSTSKATGKAATATKGGSAKTATRFRAEEDADEEEDAEDIDAELDGDEDDGDDEDADLEDLEV